MKLRLFQSKGQIEDRVEIYYTEMTPVIQKIVNVIAGAQNTNFNTFMMLIFTTISVCVLYLYKLLDQFSPLVTITLQYLIALAFAMAVLWISSLFDEISENGYRDFFVSFTVFYAIGAVVFYISTYLETKKMNAMLKDIQSDETKGSRNGN